MDRFDGLYLAGLVLVAIGLGGFFWQLGPVVIGAGLIVFGFLGAKGGTGGGEEGAGKGGGQKS